MAQTVSLLLSAQGRAGLEGIIVDRGRLVKHVQRAEIILLSADRLPVCGFHHHATLCIAAYGFLISEREAFPPQTLAPPCTGRELPFPVVDDPTAPPTRPERHVPNFIATVRRTLTVVLAKSLDRCPCCHVLRDATSLTLHL